MDIIAKAQELGEAILETEEYKRYSAADTAWRHDEKAMVLVEEYNAKKLNAAKSIADTNPSEEEVEKVRTEIAEAFEALKKNEVLNEYFEAAGEYSKMVESVTNIINMYASGNQGGCSGSCSTCGGCH